MKIVIAEALRRDFDVGRGPDGKALILRAVNGVSFTIACGHQTACHLY